MSSIVVRAGVLQARVARVAAAGFFKLPESRAVGADRVAGTTRIGHVPWSSPSVQPSKTSPHSARQSALLSQWVSGAIHELAG